MFDNPIILLIIVVAALLRWLSQKSEAKSDPERPVVPDQPIPRGGETKTEEERVRRFLEALGHPAGSEPPPRVAPKKKTKPIVFPLPPLTTAPPPLPTPPAAIMQVPEAFPLSQPAFKPAVAQEASFEVRDLSAPTSIDLATRSGRKAGEGQGFLRKLRSAQDLRDAIVLREVFGPPRGLQTGETML